MSKNIDECLIESIIDWLINHNRDYDFLDRLYIKYAESLTEPITLYRGERRCSIPALNKDRPYSFTDDIEVAKYFAKLPNSFDDEGPIDSFEETRTIKISASKHLDIIGLIKSSSLYEKYKDKLILIRGEREYLVKPNDLHVEEIKEYIKINNKMILKPEYTCISTNPLY